MNIHRHLPNLILVVSFIFSGCGGGGGSGGGLGAAGGNNSTDPSLPPTISSFKATSQTINAGGSTQLTAIFSNGNGSVNNLVGSVTTGSPVTVSPSATTTYTLTVSNGSGSQVSSSTTVWVLPSSDSISLAIDTPQFPYTFYLGGNSNANFMITGLTPGDRYTFSYTAAAWPTITYYSDAFVTPITCDPIITTGECSIIPKGNAIWLRVHYGYFDSGDITIKAQHASTSSQFEGAWDAPQVWAYSPTTTAHVGKVDKYVSYYDIQGLTIGKTYTLWAQSMTDDVALFPIDSPSHLWSGALCSKSNAFASGFEYPEYCKWTATTTSQVFAVENSAVWSGSNGSAYLLRVEEAISSEGSVASPVTFAYANSRASWSGRVADGNGTSYYRVTGLTAGSQYSLNLNNAEMGISPYLYSLPAVQTFDNDPTYITPGTCTAAPYPSNTVQCIFTATGTDLYFTVIGPVQNNGLTYSLSVTPVPVNQGGSLTPLVLSYPTSFPFAGQLSFSSEYSVSGLTPNSFYQIILSDITGEIGLAGFENTSPTLGCNYLDLTNGQQRSASCFLNSGPNGVMIVRPSSGPQGGSFFTMTVSPGAQLTAVHKDTSGPIAIQDPTAPLNPVTPTEIPIVVSGDPVTSISDVTVELFIQHGATSELTIELVAPDGLTVVTLAAPPTNPPFGLTYIQGDGLYNLKLNDYASQPLNNGSAPYMGTFRPYKPLHVLNGMNANGTWTLRIKDDVWSTYPGQAGTYYGWGITFN